MQKPVLHSTYRTCGRYYIRFQQMDRSRTGSQSDNREIIVSNHPGLWFLLSTGRPGILDDTIHSFSVHTHIRVPEGEVLNDLFTASFADQDHSGCCAIVTYLPDQIESHPSSCRVLSIMSGPLSNHFLGLSSSLSQIVSFATLSGI